MKSNLNLNNYESIVNLKRLTHENAETVLSWRNSKKVRANSLDDKKIELRDHLEFFKNLDEKKQFFFIVKIKDNPQGIFNVKKINDLTGLWGCYLSSTNTIRPGVFPLMVGLAGKFAFEKLSLQNLRSEVLAQNTAPQKLNDYLGVKKADHLIEKSSGVMCYDLPKSDWGDVLGKINKILPSRIREGLHKVQFP